MYIDRIDLTLPQEDLQSVLEAFASAASILELLPSVGPIDRKHYAKLGLKNEALTLQIIEVGRKSRHLIPAGIDFEKIDRDLVAREQLRTLKVILQGLLDRVSDSMLLTGVDLYAAALSMYHCLRRNADTASLKSTVAELKKGFARPSRKKKKEQNEAGPALTFIGERRDAVVMSDVRTEGPSSSPEPTVRAPAPQLHAHEAADAQAAHVSSPGTLSPAAARSVPRASRLSASVEQQSRGSTVSFLVPQHGLPVYFSGGCMPAIAVHTGFEQEVRRSHEPVTPISESMPAGCAAEHLRMKV